MAKRPTIPKALQVPQAAVDAKNRELVALYRGRRRRIEGLLESREKLRRAKRRRLNEIVRQINAEIAFLNRQVVDWSGEAAGLAYRRGEGISGRLVLSEGISDSLAWNTQIHRQAVAAIAEQMSLDLIGANLSIGNKMKRLIRRTQQTLISDRLIQQRLGEGLIEGATRRTLSDTIESDLWKRLDAGQMVTINGRNYRPDWYAELVARTGTREATTAGTINLGVRYEVDLYQVSEHNHEDRPGDVCPQFAGKVFSISGKSRDFPKMSQRPPFHPHCAHSMFAVVESVLRRRGEYDAAVEFSNRNVPSEGGAAQSLNALKDKDPPTKITSIGIDSERRAKNVALLAEKSSEANVVPDGWYVHGRDGSKTLSREHVIQLTQDWEVAESFAGKGDKGSIWFLEPAEGSNIFDLSFDASPQLKKIGDLAIKQFREGILPFLDEVRASLFDPNDPHGGFENITDKQIADAVKGEFAPEDILNSAQAFDNFEWINWLTDNFDVDFVITPDGAVALSFKDVSGVSLPRIRVNA